MMNSLAIVATLMAVLVMMPKKFKKIVNPCVIFCIMWFIVVFAHSLHLYRIYSASESTLNMITVGVICFCIGGLIAAYFRSKYKFKSSSSNNNYINKKIAYIMCFICIIYFFVNFLTSLSGLLHGASFNYIRQQVQAETESSGLNNFVYNFIVLPCARCLEVICALSIFDWEKNKKLVSLSLAAIIMRVISDAGRTPIFDLIFYIVIILLLGKGKKLFSKRKRKKAKRKASTIIVIAIVLFTIISVSRTSSTISRMIYFYLAMPPYMMDVWTEKVVSSNYYGYGLVSFNGLFFTIDYIIHNIFNIPYAKGIIDAYDWISKTDSDWINIAHGYTDANAYVSTFWFFYADWRLAGIIIASFVYGFFCTYIFCSYIMSPSEKKLGIYLFIAQGVLFSCVRFQFAKAYNVLAFMLLCLIVFKDRINQNDNITDSELLRMNN